MQNQLFPWKFLEFAILDRFLHNAEVIAITGKSYRLRNRGAVASDNDDDVQPKQKGRRSTADGQRLSPPEDAGAVTPVSCECGHWQDGI